MSWTIDVDFKKSPMHGTGVFARHAIAGGSRIWQVDAAMHICDRTTLEALPARKLRFALHGGYYHQPSDHFLWYSDGMQFMNHAPSPRANVGLSVWPPLEFDHTVALRDIAAGEELCEDYAFWSDGGTAPGHWLARLYAEHCPEHLAFLNGLGGLREAA